MPLERHYYGVNHLHFITASTYRRARLFDSDRFRRQFVATLAGLRAELSFKQGTAESQQIKTPPLATREEILVKIGLQS